MKITKLKNDDIKITVTVDESKELNSLGDFLHLLESYSCNGSYAYLTADELGALSESDCIVEYVNHDDSGKIAKVGKIWFFNNYMLENFWETLKEEKQVTFEAL